MIITGNEKIMLEKILVSEKELSDINFQRMKNTLMYIKNNLIDSDDNMYLTADSLTDLNNITTSSKNITWEILMLNHVDMITCI